ncbi:hypothetical protein JI666_09075 [Bacillus sp. NTK071]|uniref:hypothetical protein n=1 Tax=Bacillus sp. NTK071 TaxID=2802175 RepID=UPI001A90A889|nr:hypothetical protein [Bacillus sp. NTK071]MBN8208895.1 hypothetical protein [Bacillus sp. NTK071]
MPPSYFSSFMIVTALSIAIVLSGGQSFGHVQAADDENLIEEQAILSIGRQIKG